MEEYKGNSHLDKKEKPKETVPEKRAEKVITGAAHVKKKNRINKLSEIFFAKDIRSVGQYIAHDVLIPSLKKAAWEIFTNGLHMSLYGEPDPDRRSRGNSNVPRVSYWNQSRNSYERRDDRPRPYRGYSYDDVQFDTRGDAELAIDELNRIMNQYHIVRVADIFDTADQTCRSTDYAYGWTDISTARAVDTGDYWVIQLPRAMPLD